MCSGMFILSQNYDSSEAKLRREFEQYGAIKKVSEHAFNIYMTTAVMRYQKSVELQTVLFRLG